MAASVFALDWPVVQLSGSVPSHKALAKKVRRLDHSLAEVGVRY